jgi:dihydroxy-acid dehydratase
MVAHMAPEAALGGVLAAVHDGDRINIDVAARRVDVELDDAEIAARLAAWTAPVPRYATGVFAKYAATVSNASRGAVTGR